MELSELIPHIEALIFASERPLTPLEITELVNNAFGFMEDKINLDLVEAAIDGIREKYNSEFYPFEMRESGGGLQFLTKRAFHKTVAQLNGDKFMKRLSAAALETLAIIAYKQPITKGEIEAIRGVSTDYSIQKLLEKELIIIAGRNENMPGKPLVYQTSKSFMDYFGLNTNDDLPKIKEVLADQVMPTIVNGELVDGDETPQDVVEEEMALEEIANQDNTVTDTVEIDEEVTEEVIVEEDVEAIDEMEASDEDVSEEEETIEEEEEDITEESTTEEESSEEESSVEANDASDDEDNTTSQDN